MNIGVVLMTYGSPKTLADVPMYLKNVYGGKDASKETIKEFQRRYKLIKGSPLVAITQKQAIALEKKLNNSSKKEHHFQVVAGMRFSNPFIKDAVTQFKNDTDVIIGIIMSPQYSPIIMSGYRRELKEAVASLKRKNLKLIMVTDWHMQPYLIKAYAKRVTEAFDTLPSGVTVLFSAHSMPKKVIDKEPNYINDLKETALAIARHVGLPSHQWMFCYQSAGHTPEEWLKPDFADIMPELKKNKKTHVLIAPVQFLSDHLEILYDVGIGAKEQAEEHGIIFARTKSLNTLPLFINSLADVVKENMLMS